MSKVRKVINIMLPPPHYDLFWNEPRPEINWDTPDGQWVGVWGLDWLELIGAEVLKLTTDFEFEVWQPDLRADRIYSHTFPNNVVHKLFPAYQRKRFHGIKRISYTVSESLYESLQYEIMSNRILLRLGTPASAITCHILNLGLNCPMFMQYFGEFKGPLNGFFKFNKNMPAKVSRLREHFLLKKLLNKADATTYTSALSLRNLKKYSRKKLLSLSIGIDFDFWRRSEKREEIRKTLKLDDGQYIILSSSRLNSLKQIDKLIRVLERIGTSSDFQLIVTGHGTESYEKYLAQVGCILSAQGKLRFVGHVEDERLREFYNAADLFVMSSLSEAGPTSTIKALAMEVPVLSTDTGQMSEVMRKHNAGVIVPIKDYGVWEQELREILNGKQVKVLDREIVKSIHHWPIVAAEYIDLYHMLFKKYYG